MILSRVIPSRRGTSLLRPRIFSYNIHEYSLGHTPSTDLNEEEGDSVCPQRTTELDVAELGVQFTQIVELAMFPIYQFFNALHLDVLTREELGQVEESGLVLGLAVVAIGNLALQCRKL